MELKCHACAGHLREVPRYDELCRVTSDCRVWPAGGRMLVCPECGLAQCLVDHAWQTECDDIYGSYQIYAQSGGQEQVIASGESEALHPRSRAIVEFLQAEAGLSDSGKVLDFGCGNGGFLRAFDAAFPSWESNGLEYDSRNLETLQKIPGFARFYQRPEDLPEGEMDLIAFVHLLEHIPDPGAFLQGLTQHLKAEGAFLIQVPNCAVNPFILTVADHCSHFTPESLAHQLRAIGLSHFKMRMDVVSKEITVLVRMTSEKAMEGQASNAEAGHEHFTRQIESLCRFRDVAIATEEPVAIFGSSIGGNWLAGELKNKVRCFLDEDASRWGREHGGIPIENPAEADPELTVLVPLVSEIAAKVTPRLTRFRKVISYAEMPEA